MRRINSNLTTIIDSNICRNKAFGMEYELDCVGHHHNSSVVFFSATLFIPLSLKITIRDGFHEIL